MNFKLFLMLFLMPAVLVVAILFLTACGPASAPSSAYCQSGICVDIQLSTPIRFNEPVTATITVETDRDMPQLGVSLSGFSGVTMEGTNVWQMDIKAHQPVKFTGTMRFTQEGYVTVVGDAITREGQRVVDSVPVYISRAGGTLNPIVPTGPSQAIPYTPQSTPSPFTSPLPTPPPLESSLLSPSASQSVLVTGENFEGAFPPPGWSVQDLSPDGQDRYWGITDYRHVSGSWAVWPARNGANGIDPAQGDHNYPNNMDTRLIYGPFDLSDAGTAYAQFQLWREIELNYDYLAVEASHDGVTFQTVITWTGNSTAWDVFTARFNDYVGDNSVWIAWRFHSDSSITYDGPYVDDIYIWKYVPGEVEVHGSFAYADRAGQSQPARYMKAYLYDADPGGTDDLLDETIVASTGTFAFLQLRNWDVDGGAGQTSTTGRLDLYVVWETDYLDSTTARRRVTRFSDQVYQWNSGAPQTDISDGVTDFNYFVPSGDPQQSAMWIFQDLRRGWEYIENNTSTDPGSSTARWEKDQNSYSGCSGPCFWPSFGVFIPHASVNSSDTVVHELGHQYMYNAEGLWFTSCANHGMFQSIDQWCGYIEGWADFFPLVVNGDACYDFRKGPCEGVADINYYNLETHARADGKPEGDAVEGRVAGAMYDMFDNTNEGFDHATFGFSPVWSVVSTILVVGGSSFTDFWNNWKARGYNQHLAVQAMYQSSIDYDTTPIIANLPDRVALQNLPLIGAVDLWDYSSDQESADAELTWAVTGSTGGCGALIRDHFVDVFPPQNWQGASCNITVQVSDGIKTGSDTFNVHTVPIVARAYLPLILKDSVVQAPLDQISPNPFVSPLPLPTPWSQ